MPGKTLTMYMHTLNGKAASVQWYEGGPSLFYVGGRHRLRLEPSLRALRESQRECVEHARKRGWNDLFTSPSNYGYILVEVPDAR